MLAGQIAFAGGTLMDETDGTLWACGGSREKVLRAAAAHPLGCAVHWSPSILGLLGHEATLDPPHPDPRDRPHLRTARNLIQSALQLDREARLLERHAKLRRKRKSFSLRLARILLELDNLVEQGGLIDSALAKLDPRDAPDPLASLEQLVKALRRQIRFH